MKTTTGNHTHLHSQVARIVTMAAMAAFCSTTAAFAITDDFGDGDDTANPTWTRSNIGISAPGWDASAFNYHLTSPVGGFGFSYVGSFVGPSSSDFTITFDLLDWQPVAQRFGPYARATDINAFAGIDGYHFSYEPSTQIALIRRMINANQGGSNLGSTTNVVLDVSKDYQFIFSGAGTSLNGKIYEIGGPVTPIVDLSVTDAFFTSGVSGVIGYGSAPADFTIDNFSAEPVPEPTTFALLLLGGLALGRSLLRRHCLLA